jgi:hypothetical protein
MLCEALSPGAWHRHHGRTRGHKTAQGGSGTSGQRCGARVTATGRRSDRNHGGDANARQGRELGKEGP